MKTNQKDRAIITDVTLREYGQNVPADYLTLFSPEIRVEIIRGLRGFTSGYAIPTYVIDAPGGGGKIPVMPDYIEGREEDNLVLRNYEGNLYKYPAYKPAESAPSVFVPMPHAEA